MLPTFKKNWSGFWWSTVDLTALGKVRFLFFLLVLFFVRRELPPGWAQLDQALYRPVGIFSWLPLPFPSQDVLRLIGASWLVSVVFSCVGLFTRASCLVAFLAGFYFISFTNSFGHQYHSELLILFSLFVMVLLPAGRAFSIDNWIRRKLGLENFGFGSTSAWPLRLIQVLWVFAFFFSGVTKLRRSGLAWVYDGTLQYFLVENAVTRLVELKGNIWESAGLWLAQFPLLCTVAAGLVLLFELTTPLALKGGRWAFFYAVGSLVFLFAVFIFMGVGFGAFVPPVAFWLVRGSVWTPAKRS